MRSPTPLAPTPVPDYKPSRNVYHPARVLARASWETRCSILPRLPPPLLKSITWDQGTEMARHLSITASLGVPVFFCDSHSPWQRRSNENTNGLLRDYFPQGTELGKHTVEHLAAVEEEINRRPRITLNDRAPIDLFTSPLASLNHQVLRR